MAAIATPCTGVCAIDPATDRCRGCLRTLDEIARWSTLTDAGRRAIMATLAARQVRTSQA